MNVDAKQNEIMELNADTWRVGEASQLYRQCYEPSKVHVDTNIEALLQFMDIVGLVWPVRDVNDSLLHPLEVMLYMAAKYDTNFQFRLEVATSKIIGTILVVRRRYHSVVWEHRLLHALNLEEYAMVIRDHMNTLRLKNVQCNTTLLRELETFFIEATSYESGEGDQSWLTISELDSKTPNIRGAQWHFLLNRQHRITLQRTWNPKDWVVIEDSAILTKLDELFRTYPDPHILMGTAWMFIQSHLWVAAGKPDLMFRDNFQEKVQLACLEYVNSLFGLLASVEYLTRTYPTSEVRRGVYSFVRSLKNEFVSTLKSTAWIGHESAEKAEQKIKNTDLNILPSEHFFLLSARAGLYGKFPDINTSAFVESWLYTAESYQKLQNHARFYDVYQKRRTFHRQPYEYTYLRNSVDAATAALDPPLFYRGGTFAMNYGGSGVLLAKKIAKAIDPVGTTVNSFGENVVWWGTAHSAEYNRRLNCKLGQAAGHNAMGVFPAIPALEVSFSAYKTAVKQEGTSGPMVQDLRIRGLEEYTDDQLFFMTYCYALCSKEGDTSSQQECNLPLGHFSRFADAFYCPEGWPMNAKSKCTFFN
ncbi:membrane metallo-endopeptidase-like 1 [Rhipicephalus sanguineus]|nr:membrane metallo-endopeptidase-like 1 [Rhipicephalus sanguineus]